MKKNRILIKLRGKVVAARERWHRLVLERYERKFTYVGDAVRSPTKTLFVVPNAGEWFLRMKREMRALQKEIESAGLKGAKKPRDMWLPEIVVNATAVEPRIYRAKSPRNVSLEEARAFAKKAGSEFKYTEEDQFKFSIHARTGRNYKLRVVHQHGIGMQPFTDWAVCIGQVRVGKEVFAESNEKQMYSKFEGSMLVCTHKNSALFRLLE